MRITLASYTRTPGNVKRNMKSIRCYGETKFFRQCPRYVTSDSVTLSFCWEHDDQRQARLADLIISEEWKPLGFHLTNNLEVDVKKKQIESSKQRLKELSEDDQNVHTAEVQQGVGAAIRKLRAWAAKENVRTERNLPALIESLSSIGNDNEIVTQALDHLRHCYQWNDNTMMFGVTYPQLASWVWARINFHENRELLVERFFDEVSESAGQCLNGNMARLMNVFSALDLEMSPQEIFLSRDQLQSLAAKAVAESDSVQSALNKVGELLDKANVATEERKGWLQSVKEAYM